MTTTFEQLHTAGMATEGRVRPDRALPGHPLPAFATVGARAGTGPGVGGQRPSPLGR